MWNFELLAESLVWYPKERSLNWTQSIDKSPATLRKYVCWEMKIVCWWSLKPNEFLICITDKFLLKPSLHVQGTSRRPDWQFCHQRKWNQVSVWVWNYSFLIYWKFDMLILIILTFTKNICGRTIINQLNAKYIDIQMQEGKTNENYLNIIILRIYWLIFYL